MKLSVVISAFNEERKIARCLASVAFADEIIVVNNSSTDKTAEIAKKHKARVFNRENNPMLNINKNFGFTKAKGEWILNLDADESVSQELRDEILEVIDNEIATEGYELPRKNIIFGKAMMHTGWYPDYNLRLFKNGKGKFAEKHVHEKIVVVGEVSRLDNPIIHENYETVAQFLQKMCFIYAPNEAEQLLENGYVFSYKDAIKFPFQEFIGRFFAREGYKDGFHGLMLSFFMSFYHFIVFACLWEKKKFVDEGVNAYSLLDEEGGKAAKDFSYWTYETKIKETNNPVQKSALKILRRFLRL